MTVTINSPETVELLTQKLTELAQRQQLAARFRAEVKIIPPNALSTPQKYWEVQDQNPRGYRENDGIIDDPLFFL